MERTTPPVKTQRPYDSSRRQQQAGETRAAVLAAARELFLKDGYAQTTVAAVAAQARVSVETVYKSFGGKPGLVRAIADQALSGSGSVHAEARSDRLQAEEADPRTIIRGWGTLMVEVAPRISPILLLVRAAASTDAEMKTLFDEIAEERLQRMTHNATTLAIGGHLREGLSVDYAAEVIWTYSSPDLYALLVVGRGWPLERYVEFVAEAMICALLPSPPP